MATRTKALVPTKSERVIPKLIGVIHLAALPGSPRAGASFAATVRGAEADARVLGAAGFDGVIVENFGDAPFHPGAVPPITVAAMTACASAVRDAAPKLALGINVLRNDAEAALAVAAVTGASMIRVNVHIAARVTDQGVIEGAAHRTLRARRELGLEHIALLCDVDVKHSAPLAARPIAEEAHDLEARGLADALLVTGSGTGRGASRRDLDAVLGAVHAPVLVASGTRASSLGAIRGAHGVIVGSSLRASGRAGDPIDAALALAFARAFRAKRTSG